MRTIKQVLEFHRVFSCPINSSPSIFDKTVNRCRNRLIKEEFKELRDALKEGNIEKAFDALLDLQYVLDGTFIALGFYKFKRKGFDEVHRANMTKVGPNGKVLKDSFHKIVKPKGWKPPSFKKILPSV